MLSLIFLIPSHLAVHSNTDTAFKQQSGGCKLPLVFSWAVTLFLAALHTVAQLLFRTEGQQPFAFVSVLWNLVRANCGLTSLNSSPEPLTEIPSSKPKLVWSVRHSIFLVNLSALFLTPFICSRAAAVHKVTVWEALRDRAEPPGHESRSFYPETANAVCLLVGQGYLPEMADTWVQISDLPE